MMKIRMNSNFPGMKKGAYAGLILACMLGHYPNVYGLTSEKVTSETEFNLNDNFNPLSDPEQTITIKGQVTDKDGLPIPGVVVMVQNTTIATQTDMDGNYTITVPENTGELLFSYLGFKSEIVKIGNKTTINLVMEEDTTELEEVVVTGYQTISKERSTGSFAQIDQAQIQARPASVSIIDRIEGSAAGLNYTNGEITIRGGSSIELGNSPLIVVDGFAIEGGIETVNPEDVETINVLKDASAASIWGVRASNGVIVITTKKGKRDQKLTVTASVFTSITEKIDYDDMEWLNTSDQIDMDLEYIAKGWNFYENNVSRRIAMSLLDEAQVYRLGLAPNGEVWSQGQYDAFVAELRTRDAAADWEKYLLRSPVLNTYNISLSTGSERNTTYASLVYNDNHSASKGNRDDRLIFNIQDTYNLNNKISFTAGLNATMTNRVENGIDPLDQSRQRAYEDLVDRNGNTIQYYNAYNNGGDWNRWTSLERETLTGISHTFNALDLVRANDNNAESLAVRARFGIKAELLNDLIFDSNFQYEKGYYNEDQFQSMDHYEQRIRVANMYKDGVYQIPEGTRYFFERHQNEAWSFRNTLSYDKTWGKHKATLFGGTEIRKYIGEEMQDRKFGYNKQTTTFVPVNERDLAGGILFNWNGARYYGSSYLIENFDNREVSAFANAAYEFDRRYAINASFRVDQKNLFGSDPDFRYKPLWSAGVAWNVGNEEFISNVDWINRLKLRATIGVNGNSSNSTSPYAQARNIVTSWGANLYDFLRISQPANPELKWEETRVFNVGLDYAVLGGRLNGTVEYYSKNSTDLLGRRTLDVTNGVSSALINYASMTNKGVEFSINADILQGPDFNWRTSANLSYNKNEVTAIEDQLQSARTIAFAGKVAVGLPLDNVYSFNYAGLDNAGVIQLYNTDGTTKSWRADVADEAELIYHGNRVAPWYGGLTNTFSYHGLDLTVNLTYKWGYVFQHDYGRSYTGWSSRMHESWNNRWREPGDELTTRIPKISYEGTNPFNGEEESHFDSTDADFFYEYSQDNILDGAFVRVRDLILAYSIPQKFLDRVFFRELKFSAQVTNPFIWVANDRNVDPEAYRGTLTSRNWTPAYDNLKTFTFGLRATF